VAGRPFHPSRTANGAASSRCASRAAARAGRCRCLGTWSKGARHGGLCPAASRLASPRRRLVRQSRSAHPSSKLRSDVEPSRSGSGRRTGPPPSSRRSTASVLGLLLETWPEAPLERHRRRSPMHAGSRAGQWNKRDIPRSNQLRRTPWTPSEPDSSAAAGCPFTRRPAACRSHGLDVCRVLVREWPGALPGAERAATGGAHLLPVGVGDRRAWQTDRPTDRSIGWPPRSRSFLMVRRKPALTCSLARSLAPPSLVARPCLESFVMDAWRVHSSWSPYSPPLLITTAITAVADSSHAEKAPTAPKRTAPRGLSWSDQSRTTPSRSQEGAVRTGQRDDR
jgi:hypothetical protein